MQVNHRNFLIVLIESQRCSYNDVGLFIIIVLQDLCVMLVSKHHLASDLLLYPERNFRMVLCTLKVLNTYGIISLTRANTNVLPDQCFRGPLSVERPSCKLPVSFNLYNLINSTNILH